MIERFAASKVQRAARARHSFNVVLRSVARRTTKMLPLVFAAACAGDVALPPVPQVEYEAAFTKHKTTRTNWLATAGKANSYTGLRWIPQGTSTIGGDTTNTVVLKGRGVPPRVGILTRVGDSIVFEPTPNEPILLDSQPVLAQHTLIVEGGAKPASRVTAGSAGFRIIKRLDSIGVRAWDSDIPANAGLEALQYFPLDQAWRFPGKFIKLAKPDTQALETVSGVAEEYVNVGMVQTTIGGKAYELTAYAGSNPVDLFFTFNDATSGEETYGFRFIHAPLDTVKNTVVMDFNFAYNPECAFSAFTTCPLPTPNNRISTRITAGELIPIHKDGKK
ncbi:MAG: DUF1684 domain-containing protein [Phycisphaerae bacterium]|nr:DUF1684 domain-containing protein [Gemmatimonadaceae bacterium]